MAEEPVFYLLKMQVEIFFFVVSLLCTNAQFLMTYKNLTTQEVEEKIKQLKERVSLLEGIIKEIHDPYSKVQLVTQKNKYITTLDFLWAELHTRNGLSGGI